CFFFSSRRRHTRFSRDWSSDVCSSDLGIDLPFVEFFDAGSDGPGPHARAAIPPDEARAALRELLALRAMGLREPLYYAPYSAWRSEERRVGKERRARWAPDESKIYAVH